MTDYRDLHELSRRQHRFLTYRQARDEGVSDHRLQRWLGEGMLELPGLTVHRSRTLLSQDATAVRGVPASSVPRSLADLALSVPSRRLHAVTLDAIQRGRTDIEAIARRASSRLDLGSRRALAEVVAKIAPDRPDSIFEAEVRERLRASGYRPDPGPLRLELAGRSLTIDVPFSQHLLGIECDGFGYHADRSALDRDHRKSNLLQVSGWTLLRVTWQRLMTDWAGFMAEFRAAASTAGLQPVND